MYDVTFDTKLSAVNSNDLPSFC